MNGGLYKDAQKGKSNAGELITTHGFSQNGYGASLLILALGPMLALGPTLALGPLGGHIQTLLLKRLQRMSLP